MDEILERLFEGVEEGWDWLRGVLLGEWQEEKTLDQTVADALLGFVPGVGTMMTLRDLIAVIVRLVRHPERRDDVDQWILLVAMLLPLIITAVGALVAGVGALVGAELGAFMRAVTLFLIKHKGLALKTLIEFFQGHGYGNVVKALQQVKFTSYKDDLLREFGKQIERMERLLNKVLDRLVQLDRLPDWLVPDAVPEAIRRMQHFIAQLHALHAKAHSMLPRALLELDARLNALLSGELKQAMSATHRIPTGQSAPAVAKMEQHDAHGQSQGAGNGQGLSGPSSENTGVLRNPETPESGNTRRIPERRIKRIHVSKHEQEFRLANHEGLPVGAKPYVKGKTVMEHPGIKVEEWRALYRQDVANGYPDLAAPSSNGKPREDYANFATLEKVDLKPGDRIVRVVAHDDKPNSDYRSWWARDLPATGEQFRSGSGVKEDWNKDGSYVELTVPPVGHPAWAEMGITDHTLRGWQGKASSQRYEYKDPDTGKTVPDNAYLPGGDEQLFFDSRQLEVLKKHGFISERRPTNFPDYDPDYVNGDGSKGNIMPSGNTIFENIPLDEAYPRPPASKGS